MSAPFTQAPPGPSSYRRVFADEILDPLFIAEAQPSHDQAAHAVQHDIQDGPRER
jgi:hypothetical protein